jgi:hypothetical protein
LLSVSHHIHISVLFLLELLGADLRQRAAAAAGAALAAAERVRTQKCE